MCHYFPSDAISQSNKCQSLTLALSACKSLSATAAVMSRVVISHLQNCFSSKSGLMSSLMEQSRRSQKHFSVLFPFQKAHTGGTLKLASFLCSFCSFIQALWEVAELNALNDECTQLARGMLSIQKPAQVWRNDKRNFFIYHISPSCPDPISVWPGWWLGSIPHCSELSAWGMRTVIFKSWIFSWPQVALATEIRHLQGIERGESREESRKEYEVREVRQEVLQVVLSLFFFFFGDY